LARKNALVNWWIGLLAGSASHAERSRSWWLTLVFMCYCATVACGEHTPQGSAPEDGGTPRADTAPLHPGTSCWDAIPIPLANEEETTLTDQAFSDAAEFVSPCPGSSLVPPSRARLYHVRLAPGRTLKATAYTDLRFNLRLYFLPTCPARACLVPPVGPSVVAPATYTNETDADVDVFIVVASEDSARLRPWTTFDLWVRTETLASAVCESATPLSPGTTLRRRSVRQATRIPSGCGVPGSHDAESPAVFYSVLVPPASALEVDVLSPFQDTYARLYESCDLSECLASSRPLYGTHQGEVLVLPNVTDSPRSFILALSATRSNVWSTFDLEAIVRPIATCANAPRLTPGIVLTEQTASAALPIGAECSTFHTAENVSFYKVSVPPGNTLDVRTDHDPRYPHWRNSIRLFAACDSRCPRQSVSLSAQYTNSTSAPQDLFIAIGTPTEGAADRYSVLASLTPHPTGFRCADPTPLSEGSPKVEHETTEFAQESAPACGSLRGGLARFYSASVPAGHTLVASTTQATLRVLSGCGATSCLATSEAGSRFTARYANRGPSTQRVILAASAPGADPVSYDIMAYTVLTPANLTCATATPLLEGIPLPEENLHAAIEHPPRCVGTSSPEASEALYYRVTVPVERTLTVTATPAFHADRLVIGVLATCDASECLATPGTTSPDGSRTLHYANAASVPTSVILVVGQEGGVSSGRFSLSASFL
jgi:hypothetical protein